MSKKLTTEEFIIKAKEVHGDKYDYSKVEYVNSHTNVIIICPTHGEFLQTPTKHLMGSGCSKCSGKVKLTTEDFIIKAKEVHGDKYDYSKVEYVNNITEISIFCKKCKKFFTQKPSIHLMGSGCNVCNKSTKKLTTEDFIIKAKEVHGDKYDYSKVNYINSNTKITIICNEHGEFQQKPSNHLQGQGCSKCSKCNKLTTEDFIKEVKKVHGDKYDYSKVNYIKTDEKVCIICPTHGKFFQTPTLHKRGHGCPMCNGGNGVVFKTKHKLDLLSEYDLVNMDIHQLLELIANDILPKEFNKLVFTKEGSDKRKDTIKELEEMYSKDNINEEEQEKQSEEEYKELEKEFLKKTNSKDIEELLDNEDNENDNFPELEERTLRTYDNAYKHLISLGDKQKLIAEVEIQKIWNNVLKDSENKSEKTLKWFASLQYESKWFQYVQDTFFNEYNKVNEITVDKDYSFKYQPSLMQRLMVYRLMKNKTYGNWCGTGAGKTNAALLASRLLNCKLSVIICPNSVVSSWEKSINNVYPNSNIIRYEYLSDIDRYDSTKYNYIIFNVDKFQLTKTNKMIEKLLTLNIDFICLDEIQLIKVRNEKKITKRFKTISYLRNEAYKQNNNLYVLGMTATPLINNLQEVKSLLELITNKDYKEIGNKNSINNIHLAYKGLLLNGFRYVPNYGINVNVIKHRTELNDEEVIKNLVQFSNGDVDKIECLLLKNKLNSIISEIKEKTIIYTHYHNHYKMLDIIKDFLNENGISSGFYSFKKDDIDNREQIINEFGKGKFDVLIASSPISTGVDGLQKISNRMIILSLPWTSAEYHQLLGRIDRRGSVFNNVDIIIPQLFVKMENNNEWSWDNKRYNIIDYKKTLSDAVIDGVFCEKFNIDEKEFLNKAIESFKKGIEDYEIEREDVVVEDLNDEESKRKYSESLITSTHQKARTSTSKTMHTYFKENPNKWREYHKVREERKKTWIEDPLNVIADELNKTSNKVIADLGCGTNKLKTLVNNYKEWYSVDHFSDDETVIKSDISNLQYYIADNSVDIAVFCMSLWGTNYIDYIKEAYRYLKTNGVIYICEPNVKVDQPKLIGGALSMGYEIDMNTNFNNIDKEKTYIKFIKK